MPPTPNSLNWLYALTFSLITAAGCSETTMNNDSTKSKPDQPPKQATVKTEFPASGFIVGRVATEDDVSRGDAAFAAVGSVTSEPMKIDIPQYAAVKSEDGTIKHYVVIQAEIMHGSDGDVEAFGLRPIDDGSLLVDVSPNVTLLGTDPPAD